uniref:G-protein coupled receptors family 1 profile domain-containing protein n=1 Tax=Romanomermis culicivorax TaxID=13658 RepID=A0A915KP89_ROMCU
MIVCHWVDCPSELTIPINRSSRPQLINSPSNRILLAISLAETMTGMASLPWLLYFFTFGGYKDEYDNGLPAFWCRTFSYFSELVPTMFHAIALWSTVYLAVHRFFYIKQMTTCFWGCFDLSRTTLAISLICIFSCSVGVILIFGRWYTTALDEDGRRQCYMHLAVWFHRFNANYVYAVHYWLNVVLVYVVPCLLLVVFTALLILTIRKVNNRRKRLFGNKGNPQASANARTNRRALSNTTRMLIAVIVFVILTETPAALINMLHVLHMTFHILPDESYQTMNMALIVRNVFVLVTYPFKIAVYLSTSNEFRNTVKQLFLRNPDANDDPTAGGFSRRKNTTTGENGSTAATTCRISTRLATSGPAEKRSKEGEGKLPSQVAINGRDSCNRLPFFGSWKKVRIFGKRRSSKYVRKCTRWNSSEPENSTVLMGSDVGKNDQSNCMTSTIFCEVNDEHL